MRKQLSATPEEVLAVMHEMFPLHMDRVLAEVTIRKQQDLIRVLESGIEPAASDRGVDHVTPDVHTGGAD